MKNIAVALNDNHLIAESLKRTSSFTIYGIEDNKIVVKYFQNVLGISVEDKIDFLKSKKIEVLFLDDILNEELDLMNNYGLEIYINAEGAADYIINRYLSGDLDKDYEEDDEEGVVEELDEEDNIETNKEIIDGDEKEKIEKDINPFIIPPTINGNLFQPTIFPYEFGEEFYKELDNPSIDEDDEYNEDINKNK